MNVFYKGNTDNVPTYAHPTDAGADLKANEDMIIPVKQRRLVPTGIMLNLPHNLSAEVYSRSGLAWKHGVAVHNSPGLIDQGYQGEIMVNLINLGEKPFEIKKGDRIAQLVVRPYLQVKFTEWFGDFPNSDRGEAGHGSTGV